MRETMTDGCGCEDRIRALEEENKRLTSLVLQVLRGILAEQYSSKLGETVPPGRTLLEVASNLMLPSAKAPVPRAGM